MKNNYKMTNHSKSLNKQYNLSGICLLCSIITFLLISTTSIYSQNAKVNNYLRMIAEGRIDEVRQKLPELSANFPDEPGVILLQGAVEEDASRAMPYYKRVLEKFPNSEWAPHAAWRMIQYYSIVSDTTTAKKVLDNFRERYPSSPFLSSAVEAVRFSISDAKYNNREKYRNPSKNNETTSKTEIDNAYESDFSTESRLRKSKYGLQVGIYSTRAAAESERERFIKIIKMQTWVLEKLVLGEKKYAVVVGDYDSEEEALEAKTKFVEKECKCTPLVFKKQ